MPGLRNWSFKELCNFLEDYGFRHGHTKGSHHFYNGRIKGEDRVVQVIHSSKEKKHQSLKTMKFAIKHSSIQAFPRNFSTNGGKMVLCTRK